LSLLIPFDQAVDADLDNSEDYLVDHSIVLYLVSPDGEFVDFFTQKMEVPDIVDKIVKYAAIEKEKEKGKEQATK
jgi:cytochrome oxidase Cu insertion factor (SCO1/SenC/PrrC family)